MKQVLYILLPFIFLSFSNEGKLKHTFESKYIKCTYETNDGRLDGNYVSYYTNGQKKAEGKFENNYRIGKWTVWDSTGRVRMQREYTDPFAFKRLIPEVPKDKVIELLNVTPYTIQYNKDNYIELFKLKERSVVWTKRIWRSATAENNKLLFDNNKLFSILNKNILNKNITAYQTTDDEFRKELQVTSLDTASLKLIAFKIKEDFVFDAERLVSEWRIIGICPVAIQKQDTLDLYWVYFPETRKYLAQEKIQSNELPTKIKTIDDLFFYRYFSAPIYKEENVYERSISDYMWGKEIEKEAERIELNTIEYEHDIWISFTK